MEDKFRVLRNAEKYVVNRQYDRAVIEYRKIVESHGEDPSVLNTLGDLLLKVNQRDQAIGCFSRVAEVFSQSGFISKAIATYRKIEQLNPSARDAVGKLAELYTRRGLRLESLKYWRRYATLSEQAGERESLLSARRQVAELDGQNPVAHCELAESLCLSSPDEASSEFVAAARLYLAGAAYAEARDCAKQALTLDATNFSARELLAEADEHLPKDLPEVDPVAEEAEAAEEKPAEPVEEPAGADELQETETPADLWADFEPQPESADLADAGPPVDPVGVETFAFGATEPTQLQLGGPENQPEEVSADFEGGLSAQGGSGLSPQQEEVDDLQAEADEWSRSLADEAFFEMEEAASEMSEAVGSVDAAPTEPDLEDTFFADVAEPETVPDLAQSGSADDRAGVVAVEAGGSQLSPEASREIRNLLEEVDFYRKLDLHEDARRILQELLVKYPADSAIRKRAEEFGMVTVVEAGPEARQEVAEPADSRDSSFEADVDSALEDLFFDPVEEGDENSDELESDLGGAGGDDFRSDFELGVAYRDMGMFEDAVSKLTRAYELSVKEERSGHALNCAAMLASTHLLMENPAESLKWSEIAFGLPRYDSIDYRALEYDRAAALEMSGRTGESLEAYKRIMADDPDFRDVQDRVARLDRMPG